jgi:hypothetical protein
LNLLPEYIWQEVQVMKSIYYVISSSFLSSCFFGLFLNTLGLCSSLNMKHQVAHPLEATEMTTYILKFVLLYAKWEERYFGPNDSRDSLNAARS